MHTVRALSHIGTEDASGVGSEENLGVGGEVNVQGGVVSGVQDSVKITGLEEGSTCVEESY